jgi:hypothetical protein
VSQGTPAPRTPRACFARVHKMKSFSLKYAKACANPSLVSTAAQVHTRVAAHLERGVQREVHNDAHNKQPVVLRERLRIELRQQRCCARQQAQPCGAFGRVSASAGGAGQ